jgi:hypothetical protein
MNQIRYWFLLILSLWTFNATALDIHIMNDDFIRDLRGQFARATSPQNKDLSKITESDWNCSLYGMKTKAQAEHNLKLYHFSNSEKRTVMNEGFLRIPNYEIAKSGLVGDKGILRDVIRMQKDGSLIAELSLPRTISSRENSMTSSLDQKRWVVSYAICKK